MIRVEPRTLRRVMVCDGCPTTLEVVPGRDAARALARSAGWFSNRPGGDGRSGGDLCPACRGDRANPAPDESRRANAERARAVSRASAARAKRDRMADAAELLRAGEALPEVARRLGLAERTVVDYARGLHLRL